MIIVRFNQWQEFIGELRSEPPDDRLVRVTVSLRYDGQKAPHATLVAGYLSDERIIEFVRYLGPRSSAVDGQYEDEVQELISDARARLEKLGFEVRSGRYHVPLAMRP